MMEIFIKDAGAGFISLLMLIAFYILIKYLYRFFNRYMRHIDIKKNGWPPPHCDADGDFKIEEDGENE